MTILLLARHGQTDWNREGRLQGQTDRPLDSVGRRQARELAAILGEEAIDVVYSSDLRRARDTAEAVAAPRGLPVLEVPELREKDFGSWEGLTDVEIRARFPESSFGGWGDGETTEAVAARVLEVLGRIAVRHDNATVLVVSHGGPIAAVRRHAGADEASVLNGDVIRLTVEDGRFRVAG
jgi:broad specificity phosphatase PhoE